MTKKSSVIILSLVSLVAVALSVGHVFAAYAVTDNANSFAVNIRAGRAPRTITFHTPDMDDTTCLSFEEDVVDAEYGNTLTGLVDVPSTASFLGFSFSGWYLEDTFENAFSNSTPIENDMDLYAKFTRNDVLYDGVGEYFVSSNNNQTVSTQYIYKIDNQVWGITPETSNENKIDLLTASGIYKMTFSTNWTILRKIGLNAKDCSWWGNDDYVSYVYGTTTDNSEDAYGHPWWDATLSISSVYVNNSDHKTGEVYIDYAKTYLGIIRCNPSNDPVLNDAESPYIPTNTTKETSLAGYNKYETYLYWSNDWVVPTWGTGE